MKKSKSFDLDFLAGALGLEPRTNGFGVAQKVRNPLKILAFATLFRASKLKMLCADAFLML